MASWDFNFNPSTDPHATTFNGYSSHSFDMTTTHKNPLSMIDPQLLSEEAGPPIHTASTIVDPSMGMLQPQYSQHGFMPPLDSLPFRSFPVPVFSNFGPTFPSPIGTQAGPSASFNTATAPSATGAVSSHIPSYDSHFPVFPVSATLIPSPNTTSVAPPAPFSAQPAAGPSTKKQPVLVLEGTCAHPTIPSSLDIESMGLEELMEYVTPCLVPKVDDWKKGRTFRDSNTRSVLPRPSNSFMCYKSHEKYVRETEGRKWSGGHVGKVMAERWAAEPKHIQLHFGMLFLILKRIHILCFPGYVYRPARKGAGGGIQKKGAPPRGKSGSSRNGQPQSSTSAGLYTETLTALVRDAWAEMNQDYAPLVATSSTGPPPIQLPIAGLNAYLPDPDHFIV